MCAHACKYIDQLVNNTVDDHDDFAKKASKLLGIDDDTTKNFNDMKDLADGPKKIFEGLTVEERNVRAMKQIETKLEREDAKVKDFHHRKHEFLTNEAVTAEVAATDPAPTEVVEPAEIVSVPVKETPSTEPVSVETAPASVEAVPAPTA